MQWVLVAVGDHCLDPAIASPLCPGTPGATDPAPDVNGAAAMTEDDAPDRPKVPTRGERSDRPAGNPLASIDYSRPRYPHDIHPALVPGIGIDEQRRSYSVDKIVFGVAGVLAVAFVI